MPDSEVVMASGRLKARKSVSGSGRRSAKRQHDNLCQRMLDCSPVALDRRNVVELLRHRLGGPGRSAGPWPEPGESRGRIAETAGDPSAPAVARKTVA